MDDVHCIAFTEMHLGIHLDHHPCVLSFKSSAVQLDNLYLNAHSVYTGSDL